MKTQTLLLVGAAGVGAYFLFRNKDQGLATAGYADYGPGGGETGLNLGVDWGSVIDEINAAAGPLNDGPGGTPSGTTPAPNEDGGEYTVDPSGATSTRSGVTQPFDVERWLDEHGRDTLAEFTPITALRGSYPSNPDDIIPGVTVPDTPAWRAVAAAWQRQKELEAIYYPTQSTAARPVSTLAARTGYSARRSRLTFGSGASGQRIPLGTQIGFSTGQVDRPMRATPRPIRRRIPRVARGLEASQTMNRIATPLSLTTGQIDNLVRSGGSNQPGMSHGSTQFVP